MPARDLKEQRDPTAEEDEGVEVEAAQPLDPILLPLSEEQQKELVEIVLEDLQNGLDARSKMDWGKNADGDGIAFDDKFAELVVLYEGEDVKRPEKWMCGRSLKIAQSVVELLVARLIPSVWNENSHRWKPVEFTDKVKVAAVNKIMGWVLNTWMNIGDTFIPSYVRAGVMFGTVVAETRWDTTYYDLDETEETPLVDEMGAPMMDDIGAPMTIETKILKNHQKPVVDLIPISRFITQPGQTDIQKEPVVKLEDFRFSELESWQKRGLAENVSDLLKAGIKERVSDAVDAALAEAEKIANLNAKIRTAMVESAIWYGAYDADQDGFDEEICCMVARNEKVFIRAYKTSKISRRGRRPFELIPFIPRLYKLFGLGVLEQVKPLAMEIDACFRQLQDANTLSIMRWGFYDPNSDYDPDEHVAKPRAMYPVTNPTQNVYFPDIQIPVERLLNAIKLVLEFVERLTAASSYAMGKESDIVGGSGTATRTNAIMSSADIRFNMPAASLRYGLSRILTNIFDLCYMNMPEGLEKRIVGENEEPIFDTTDAVKDAMVSEMDCYLMANPSFGDANTERQLAGMLYDKFVLGGNPLIVGDVSRLYHATANVFQAYGEDPAEWLGAPPVKKETNDPAIENTIIRGGRVIHAEPQENHLEHIMVHSKYFQEQTNQPDILLWPKEAIQVLQQHIEEHKQMMVQMLQFQKKGQKGANPNGESNSGANGASQGAGQGASGESGLSGDEDPSTADPANQNTTAQGGSPAVGY